MYKEQAVAHMRFHFGIHTVEMTKTADTLGRNSKWQAQDLNPASPNSDHYAMTFKDSL